MSATLLTQLETAETIPAGSLYMMEAGDGSGTKTVTQETLEQKMGQALKVGDLTELATEEKETLVGAINEAAQSGGGAAVDVLDSREEIEANTQSGKSAGALAVKEMVGELNSNLESVKNRIYISEMGNTPAIHVQSGSGGQTAVTFKKEYSNPPIVLATLKHVANGVTIGVDSLTKTGCNIVIVNGSNSPRDVPANYIVISND